jgi:hypothetical protein
MSQQPRMITKKIEWVLQNLYVTMTSPTSHETNTHTHTHRIHSPISIDKAHEQVGITLNLIQTWLYMIPLSGGGTSSPREFARHNEHHVTQHTLHVCMPVWWVPLRYAHTHRHIYIVHTWTLCLVRRGLSIAISHLLLCGNSEHVDGEVNVKRGLGCIACFSPLIIILKRYILHSKIGKFNNGT